MGDVDLEILDLRDLFAEGVSLAYVTTPYPTPEVNAWAKKYLKPMDSSL